VNQCPFFDAEVSANYCEVLPHRTVAEKLSNQCISIPFGFCKEQNPRSKAIDAMYDKGSLSLRLKFCRKQRPCGRCIGAFYGHSRKSGRFIDGHDGIVFVELDKLP